MFPFFYFLLLKFQCPVKPCSGEWEISFSTRVAGQAYAQTRPTEEIRYAMSLVLLKSHGPLSIC